MESLFRHPQNRSMAAVTKQVAVTAESPHVGGRADRLIQELTGVSRSQVTGLFDHDCVHINGSPAKEPGQPLAEGDVVFLKYDNARRYHPQPRPRYMGFDVVFEDADLIVVIKPPELLTVPTPRGDANTLIDRVSEYVRKVRGGRGAFAVHRLDRGVSGLLVFGKRREISDRIRDQFEMHKPERRYVALVAGRVQQREGEFRSYLATDKALNRFSTDDEEVGQLAITHYRCFEDLPQATLVEVWLETGRRNQIRVHFAEAGHPVLGDPRYLPEEAKHRLWPYQRIALHAQTLAFDHPATGERLRFESQLPREMTEFLNAARGAARKLGDSPPAKRGRPK